MYRVISSVAAVAVAVVVAMPVSFAAQKPVTQSEAVTATFVIEAIDHTNRLAHAEGRKGRVRDHLLRPRVRALRCPEGG